MVNNGSLSLSKWDGLNLLAEERELSRARTRYRVRANRNFAKCTGRTFLPFFHERFMYLKEHKAIELQGARISLITNSYDNICSMSVIMAPSLVI